MSGLSLAKSLELALTQHGMSGVDVSAACVYAGELHLASVCVLPVHVQAAREAVAGTSTRVSAMIGFPYGQETVTAKIAAIEAAQKDGAHELVVALDQSSFVAGNAAACVRELRALIGHLARRSLINTRGHSTVSVCIETPGRPLDHFASVWEALGELDVDILRTGMGHRDQPAVTLTDIHRLRAVLPDSVAICAVGNISDLEGARALLSAGAARVGSGSALAIAHAERMERQP